MPTSTRIKKEKNMNEKKSWKNWIVYFIFAVAIILVYNILGNLTAISEWLKNLTSMLMPFLLGILLAYLFYMPCRSVETLYKKSKLRFVSRKSRGLSVLTVYLLALLALVIIINFILPVVSKSIVELASNLPTYYQNAVSFIESQPEDSLWNKVDVTETINTLESIDISKLFSVENIINYVKSAIGIVNVLFSAFITIVISIYILLARRDIVDFFRRLSEALFEEKTCENLSKYFSKTNEIFFKFISSQILDGVIVGTILSIVMLVMDVKYAVLLGFMIGIFNVIPYFGAIIGTIIAFVITIFTGGFSQAIGMAVVTVILQQIDSNIINPKIIGNSLKLNPILVIFAVTVGGSYFGILGMFLSVPIIAVLKLLVNDFIDYRREMKK